jgi:hypothetical protein
VIRKSPGLPFMKILTPHLRRIDRILRIKPEPERKLLTLVQALPETFDAHYPFLEVICADQGDTGWCATEVDVG